MTKGKFIVLEGIDGSGKSTQAKMLYEKFLKENIPCKLHCEPTKNPMGKLLREYLSGRINADELAIASLFAADRIEHITSPDNGLIKDLENGCNVICDRYYFSSYAYNCHSHPVETVIDINRICSEKLRPDLTVFIDISPETAMQRINLSREEKEIYESKEYLSAVRERYMKAFELTAEKENVVVIEGNLPPAEIADKVWKKLTFIEQ